MVEHEISSRHLRIIASSKADELGYLGQQAVSDAVPPGEDYRIIGGHMVRLLLELHPTPSTTPRSTLDADTAIGDLEVVGPLSDALQAQGFTKKGGNVFTLEIDDDSTTEINVLLPRLDHASGLRPLMVEGVGQVDSLPELSWVMQNEPIVLDVTTVLRDGRSIEYRTRIPGVEAAVVLKAHAWKARRMATEKDLADLATLFEIRHFHADVPWQLDEPKLIGFRKDTARILHDLATSIPRRSTAYKVPKDLDRTRLAALVQRHVSVPK
ncbi:MAG: hypothetical protein L0H93_21735 [Nocardioides sp.]|nr:hypothetical protein [Nocardioides sp.]